MFLSEWREFPSAPCLAGKKKTWWQLASRCCWKRARPWLASELVSFLLGLRSYQQYILYMYFESEFLMLNFGTETPAVGHMPVLSPLNMHTSTSVITEAGLWFFSYSHRGRRLKGKVLIQMTQWEGLLTIAVLVWRHVLSDLSVGDATQRGLYNLIHDVYRSHKTTYHSPYDSSGRVIISSQWPLPDNTQHSRDRHPCPLAGFKPTISAGKRPQTHALDRAATGISMYFKWRLSEML